MSSPLVVLETAEEVARACGISRADADDFALASHRRAIAAIDAGRFAAEILPVQTAQGIVDTDEGPRRDTSAELLAGLRPVVSGGSFASAGSATSLRSSSWLSS